MYLFQVLRQRLSAGRLRPARFSSILKAFAQVFALSFDLITFTKNVVCCSIPLSTMTNFPVISALQSHALPLR